jgi:protein phosphatase PTC7
MSSSAPYRTYSTSKRSPNPRKFSYHIAASFIAKDRPFDPNTHVFHFNPYAQIQQPKSTPRSSRPESGHDAFFVSRVSDTGSVAFGVADGVGGWTESGVDPADFSHGLCAYMASAAREAREEEGGRRVTSRQLMQRGYGAVCDDPSVQAGGSTACVAIGRPDGTLDVANLGDSGFLQLRLNAVHSFSEPQTHAFNTPYQLSVVPPSMAAKMAAYGGAQLSDLPRDADVSEHDVRHGDVLVFATDGVLDNLFNQDILRTASRVMVTSGAWETSPTGGVRAGDDLSRFTELQPSPFSPGKQVTLQSLLATQLVGAAKKASVNTRVDGPFAKEVQRYFPQEDWRGGKVDDICVVVAVVSEEGDTVKAKL